MLSFPNAKINIGLRVLDQRPDGYHNIETVFYPVAICDILEFVPLNAGLGEISRINLSGIQINGLPETNLCIKAFELLKNDFKLPPLDIHLHKIIPVGAGLGGGSSDAAFMLRGLNEWFELDLREDKLFEYASQLGSDCAFFIHNKPILGYERGDRLREIDLSLKDMQVVIINPGIHINTAEAYAGITPVDSGQSLADLIKLPVPEWQNVIVNDFESSVMVKYPSIADIKMKLYEIGAVYASISGSGSSVYGLFDHVPDIKSTFEGYFHWSGELI